MSVNSFHGIGNLGADPEVKVFDGGGKIAQFNIALTERGYTTKDGKTIPDRTDWIPVVLRGGLADVAEKYLKKGSKVYIAGEIRVRSWDDKDGNKRYVTEVYGDSLELLTPKESGSGSSGQERDTPPPPPADDDLPF